jgi:hypothetical protein
VVDIPPDKKVTTMTDVDYLLNQLNLLIGFLDVSDEKIYHQIKGHDRFNLGLTIEQLYKGEYDNYSSHISTSAFILGFTHFEDYVTKRLTKYLERHPHKNDLKVPMRVITEKGDELNSHLAYEQARRLTFAEKIKFIEKHIPDLDAEIIAAIKYANDLRNCLMHNNGVADNRLSAKYNVGDKIILTSGQVHGFGLKTRQFARDLWDKTNWLTADTSA